MIHSRTILLSAFIFVSVTAGTVLLPVRVLAQAEHVPVEHPVYDFLNRMHVRGAVDLRRVVMVPRATRLRRPREARYAPGGVRTTRLRISVMSSMAKRTPSRPRPLFFTPP